MLRTTERSEESACWFHLSVAKVRPWFRLSTAKLCSLLTRDRRERREPILQCTTTKAAGWAKLPFTCWLARPESFEGFGH